MSVWEDVPTYVAVALGIIAARTLLSRLLLRPFFAARLDPVHVQSATDHTAKAFLHGALLLFGLLVFPAEDWFSWTSLQGVWRDFPNQQQSPRLRWYYFTQCGSFLAAFAYHFIEDKKKDFWMMLFHHVCSVVLISGSWTWGAARIGCVVLFSRELSDVCIHAAKAYSLMGPQYSTLATSWFVVLLTTWVPLRLILYPILIRSAMLDSLPAVAQYPHLNVPWWVCCVGLSTLAPMDWIWFSFGVSIGLRKLKTGKLEDSRDIRKKAA
eukprot:EG_transcript_18685